MTSHVKTWLRSAVASTVAILGIAACAGDDNRVTEPSNTVFDSVAFLARKNAGAVPQASAQAVTVTVTAQAGDLALITITSTECSGVNDLLTVSGAISGTISTDACRQAGRQVTLGPATVNGSLSFTLRDNRFGTGYFIASGAHPSYSVIVEDGFGDFDNNDVVLSVEMLTNCQMNVVRRSQGGSEPWANDPYDALAGETMSTKGCAVSSLAMALTQAGIPVTPGELNEFMKTHDAFSSSGHVLWDVTARAIGPLGFKYRGSTATSYVQLARQLCKDGKPVVIGVNLDAQGRPGHFVIATGVENGRVKIADPGYELRTFLDDPAYQNKFSVRGTVGDPPGDISAFNVVVDDADLLVTDPLARQSGRTMTGQNVLQILQSAYGIDRLDDDVSGAPSTSTMSHVEIFQPFDGSYQIQVKGTRAGAHEIRIDGYCADGSKQPITRIPVTLGVGQVATFTIEYTSCQPLVPMTYFPMDENNAATIIGQGRVAPTLTNIGRPTSAIAAHVGLGRTLNDFNSVFADRIDAVSVNNPFVIIPAGHSWTVAVWFNKDLGYWGSGSGGGDFAGTGPYNLSAAFLLSPAGQSDVGQTWPVVYPLNWRVLTSPEDVSLGSVELDLYYRDPTTGHKFVHTGFFANELVPTSDGWHHLAVVNDLTGNSLTFYVDGVVVYAQTAVDVSEFGSGSTKGQIRWKEVGNNVLLNNSWGSMDELYIFDRALSAAELRALGIMP